MKPWMNSAPEELELMLKDMLRESQAWSLEGSRMDQNQQWNQQPPQRPQPVWNPSTGRWEYPQPPQAPQRQAYPPQQQASPQQQQPLPQFRQQPPQQPSQQQQYPQYSIPGHGSFPQQQPQQPQGSWSPSPPQMQQGPVQNWGSNQPYPQYPSQTPQPIQQRPPQMAQYPQQVPPVPPGVVPPKPKESVAASKKRKVLLYGLIGLLILSGIAFAYTVFRFLNG